MSTPETPKGPQYTRRITRSHTNSPSTPSSTHGSGSALRGTSNTSLTLSKDDDCVGTPSRPSLAKERSRRIAQYRHDVSRETAYLAVPDISKQELQFDEDSDTPDSKAQKFSSPNDQCSGNTKGPFNTTPTRKRHASSDHHTPLHEIANLITSDVEDVSLKVQSSPAYKAEHTTDPGEDLAQPVLSLGLDQESEQVFNDSTPQLSDLSSDTDVIMQDCEINSSGTGDAVDTSSKSEIRKDVEKSTHDVRPPKWRITGNRISDQIKQPRPSLQSSGSAPEALPSEVQSGCHASTNKMRRRVASMPASSKYPATSDSGLGDVLNSESPPETRRPETVPPSTTTVKFTPKNKIKKSASAVAEAIAECLQNNKKKKSGDILSRGYIYMYTMESCPNYVKIGSTEKSPELRIEEWKKDCRINFIKIGDSLDRAISSFVLVEKIIQFEFWNERRQYSCSICQKGRSTNNICMEALPDTNLPKQNPRDHIEWYEASEEHALKVLQRWHSWMLRCSPYKPDQTLRRQWLWKLEAYGKDKDIDWDEWTQPFTLLDTSRYLLHCLHVGFEVDVKRLEDLIVNPGFITWVAFPYIFLNWVGAATLFSVFLSILFFFWVALKYD